MKSLLVLCALFVSFSAFGAENIIWGSAVKDRHAGNLIIWGDAVKDRHAVGSSDDNIVWSVAVKDRHANNLIIWGDAVKDRHAVGSSDDNIVWSVAVKDRHALGATADKTSAIAKVSAENAVLDLNVE